MHTLLIKFSQQYNKTRFIKTSANSFAVIGDKNRAYIRKDWGFIKKNLIDLSK